MLFALLLPYLLALKVVDHTYSFARASVLSCSDKQLLVISGSNQNLRDQLIVTFLSAYAATAMATATGTAMGTGTDMGTGTAAMGTATGGAP